MKYETAIRHVEYVVDDAGSGRRIGADSHAIVRRAGCRDLVGEFPRYSSWLLGWNVFDVFGDGPDRWVFCAVHSYLDVVMTSDEAYSLAVDYLCEIGILAFPCLPDRVCRDEVTV